MVKGFGEDIMNVLVSYVWSLIKFYRYVQSRDTVVSTGMFAFSSPGGFEQITKHMTVDLVIVFQSMRGRGIEVLQRVGSAYQSA